MIGSVPPPPPRRVVPSAAPRVGFLTAASPPKPPWTQERPPRPPWTQERPPRPPEVNRNVLSGPAYRLPSSSRSLSVAKSSKPRRAALIVAVPIPPAPFSMAPSGVCVDDRTFYAEAPPPTRDVSLPTCLTKPATRHPTATQTPAPSMPEPMGDVSLAAPQHQPISNARPEFSTDLYTPQLEQTVQQTLITDFDDFSGLTLTPFEGSHDEYAMYNDSDFLPTATPTFYNTPTLTNQQDPRIESAAVPPSTAEEILANVDVGDFEKEVDIAQWMKYLQDDSETIDIPGLEENIFERVESEPTTPELGMGEAFQNDYFAVPCMPSSSRHYGAQTSTLASEIDPVQEFFPAMTVDVSNVTSSGYGYDLSPEWQTYQQYSPSHTPASIVSDVSTSSTPWSNQHEPARTMSRKRPYPAPSVSSTLYGGDEEVGDYRAKRDKNNRASQISRQKHKDKVEFQKKEVNELTTRNEVLKLEVETLEQQIATMRAVLMDSIGNAAK